MSDAGITAGDFDFTGKRVLITGAAGGIGEAMAEAFAAQGATIVAADRNVDGMAALGDRIAVADRFVASRGAHDGGRPGVCAVAGQAIARSLSCR